MTMTKQPLDRAAAIDLLSGLVAIPSLSRREEAASIWLAAHMQRLGYDRAYVDEVGNAVGEIGAPDAAHRIVLLGHIDTVPGNIPVRIEATENGDILYGRGSVDAKGPLATFAAAGAMLGAQWAREHNLHLVVVGAVEEEAATSRGARHISRRFHGRDGSRANAIPDACVIGEPSSWQRVTLGYKGRLLVEIDATQPMAHTAGPDMGIAAVAVELWNWCAAYAARTNEDRPKAFDQLMPSLRHIQTSTDEAMQDRVTALFGLRLPLDFDVPAFVAKLVTHAAARIGAPAPASVDGDWHTGVEVLLDGAPTTLRLRFHGHEPTYRGERDTDLVRAFLGAIRSVGNGARPSFVVKTGTSDMNVVAPIWRCPILAYGPGDSTLDHTPHEHIHLDEYWNAVLVLAEALRSLAAHWKST
jgi:LysW-gamma-L-lysine carboxypeptidase